MAERQSITVVGAGTVGRSLAVALVRAGHQVRFAARDVDGDSARAVRAELDVPVVPLDRATDGTTLVVLAVPATALADAVRGLGATGDVVLVDATNAVGGPPPGGAATMVDVILGVAPSATVVKAFNTIGAEAFLDPAVGDERAFLPVAGPEPAATLVADLARDLGFDARVVGDRDAVVHLEAFARLWIHLALVRGWGRDLAFVVGDRAA